jgi:hypothetical protein
VKVDSKCHCGVAVYEAEVEPGTIGIQHCSDCQQFTGSPFRANIPAPAAPEWTKRRLSWIISLADVPEVEGQP